MISDDMRAEAIETLRGHASATRLDALGNLSIRVFDAREGAKVVLALSALPTAAIVPTASEDGHIVTVSKEQGAGAVADALREAGVNFSGSELSTRRS